MDERPILNIEGELVALGPLRRDLIPAYHRWDNDFSVTRSLRRPRVTTIEHITAEYEELGKAESHVGFTSYERASWRPIGFAYLAAIDHRNRTAEYGIVIGEADCRGKGYGTEVTRLTLDYAFTALGLHSVLLRVYEFNQAGRRAYEKAGFREIGRRRQCQLMGGTLWDVIYMDCLATEFVSPVLGTVFMPDEER